jgi:hypothetical protein
MVKYEKLNPKISSPTSIPVYGEIMTARWAYEALATYQFMNNDYQSQFYPFDKVMSDASYRKDYWVVELINKAESISRSLHDPEKAEDIKRNLELLQVEISDELNNNEHVQFAHLTDLTPDRISEDILGSVKKYLNEIKSYNIKLYNKANTQKDKLVKELRKTDITEEVYFKTRREHHNESLAEFVTNSNVTERIIEYKNHLYQKIDPIYMDPEHKLLKAHFYAPRKKVFSTYISTFGINIAVIWFISLVLYLVLYYRWLKKLLDLIEQFTQRFKRGS